MKRAIGAAVGLAILAMATGWVRSGSLLLAGAVGAIAVIRLKSSSWSRSKLVDVATLTSICVILIALAVAIPHGK